MENISKVFCNKKMYNAANQYEEYELQNGWEAGKGPWLVEKEMGICRRKRRSVHGRDFAGKIPASFNLLSPTTIYASCLEISEENVIDTIMDGCTNVEEMIKKLKEQTISLTKKRCIKTKLTPVKRSKILKLSFAKKLKYRMGITYSKLKIGFRNFLYTFELWYSSLKVIEGKFGSSVATYFKFLRKLFILNWMIFLLNFFFIILPQIFYVQLATDNTRDLSNGSVNVLELNSLSDNSLSTIRNLEDESNEEMDFFFFSSYTYMQSSNLRLGNIFTGMGYLSDSVLFYGHYTNSSFSLASGYAYDIPSAYFFSIAFCYFLVLCVLFSSVAESYQKCYIETSSGVQNVFAEKIFCGWDFGIAKSDAEELKYCNIYMELKELLNESGRGRKNKSFLDSFYTMMIRVSLNLILLLLLIALAWYTSTYLDMHMDNADIPTIMMLMLILTLFTTLAPVIFSWLARIEFYTCPRTALYVTLIRTFVLHILIVVMVVAHRLNSASQMVCWETVVGQDMYRLVALDFIVGVGDNMIEFIRSRMNKKWKKIERPEFNIARNTMNLIYNQTLLYIGLYFSPGLSLIVSLKMLLTFYLKKWGAMYNCQPSKKPWRAAQMQTVFLSFAFLAFFGVIVAYGYIVTSVKTSTCGPFGGGKFVFEALLYEILHDGVNSPALLLLSHFLRSGVVVIVLLLMILAIYYLRSVNTVRRRILENMHNIIKEQVANKKKLLMKIHKAQEDFKSAMKKNKHDRKNRRSLMKNSSAVFSNGVGDSSSDPDDQREDSPLRWRSRNAKDNQILRSRNKLSKSTYDLNALDEAYNNKSRRMFTSLENLHPECCPKKITEHSESRQLANKLRNNEVNTIIDRFEISTEEDEEEIVNGKTLNTEKVNLRDKKDCQIIPNDLQGNNCYISKRSFNYDDRMPSRIYFGRNLKKDG